MRGGQDAPARAPSGDDKFVSNPKIFAESIRDGIANAILIKLNQIGTVSETLSFVDKGWWVLFLGDLTNRWRRAANHHWIVGAGRRKMTRHLTIHGFRPTFTIFGHRPPFAAGLAVVLATLLLGRQLPKKPQHFMNLFLVILGSAIGGGLRYWMSGVVAHRFGESFPWGTLLVNVLGSFAIGFFATLTGTEGRWLVPPAVRIFFMAGIFGGFTTFSSFSLQTLSLVRDAEWLYAGLNVIGSVTLCLIFVWLGHCLASTLNR